MYGRERHGRGEPVRLKNLRFTNNNLTGARLTFMSRKFDIWVIDDIEVLLLMFLGIMIKLCPLSPYLLKIHATVLLGEWNGLSLKCIMEKGRRWGYR